MFGAKICELIDGGNKKPCIFVVADQGQVECN